MNLQEKLSAIQAETAAANAKAAASERRTLELKIQNLKMELKIRKLLATPNFPEETKQRILAQLRKLKDNACGSENGACSDISQFPVLYRANVLAGG